MQEVYTFVKPKNYLISAVDRLKIIAFTHKSIEVNQLSRFFIPEEERFSRLTLIKAATGIDELFYLATCNRIEFVCATNQEMSPESLSCFFENLNPLWDEKEIEYNIRHCQVFQGEAALSHLLNVVSSIDSLVVGEREIVGQVRSAYEWAQKSGFTGDFLRLIDKVTVKTAKEVYSQTKIAEKSVSVVFLAYQMLKKLNVKLDARVLIVGSGQTNSTMSKYLLKHGFKNFTVFNRTLENAQTLANELKGNAYSLAELDNYKNGFDVLISCTNASEPVVSRSIYEKLLVGESNKKVIIDLAIPADIDSDILSTFQVNYIGIGELKAIAKANLGEREKEILAVNALIEENIREFMLMLKHRKVELAMQQVPEKIKEIRHTAINTVFAEEIGQLDLQSREVLDKVLAYVEKKYISVPMILAKDIIIGKEI